MPRPTDVFGMLMGGPEIAIREDTLVITCKHQICADIFSSLAKRWLLAS